MFSGGHISGRHSDWSRTPIDRKLLLANVESTPKTPWNCLRPSTSHLVQCTLSWTHRYVVGQFHHCSGTGQGSILLHMMFNTCYNLSCYLIVVTWTIVLNKRNEEAKINITCYNDERLMTYFVTVLSLIFMECMKRRFPICYVYFMYIFCYVYLLHIFVM